METKTFHERQESGSPSDGSRKPVRLSVKLTVNETLNMTREPMLKAPFADALYDASIVTIGNETRSSANFAGAFAQQKEGKTEHSGVLLVHRENLADVSAKVKNNIDELLDKHRVFGTYDLETEDPLPVPDRDVVPLGRETADRNGQQREGDRDVVGAEPPLA